MSQEGVENTVPVVPREPLSEETVQTIADRVLVNLRSSTQDGGTSQQLDKESAHIAPQQTDTGEPLLVASII